MYTTIQTQGFTPIHCMMDADGYISTIRREEYIQSLLSDGLYDDLELYTTLLDQGHDN